MSNAIFPIDIRGLTYPTLKRASFDPVIQSSVNKYEVRIAQMVNPTWYWELIYDYVDDGYFAPLPHYAPYTDYQVMQGFNLARGGPFYSFLFDDRKDDNVGPVMWRFAAKYNTGDIILDNNGHLQTALNSFYSGFVTPTFNQSGGVTTESTGLQWQDGGVYPALNTLGQSLQLIQDTTSGTWYTPIQRNMGGMFYEDVTDLIPYFSLVIGGGAFGTDPVLYANGTQQILATNYTIVGPGVSINGAAFTGLAAQWIGTPTGPITGIFNFYFRVRFATDGLDFEQFLRNMWTNGGSQSKSGKGYLDLMTARPNSN